MENLRVFSYQGSNVRTVTINGQPWFVAKNVCDILELANVGQALSRLDDDERNTITLNDGTPGNPNVAIVNEPGLYSLILSSRKPEARNFKRWVGTKNETYLPTFRRPSQTHPRLPGSHGHPWRPQGHRRASRQGPSSSRRLRSLRRPLPLPAPWIVRQRKL